MESTKPTHVMPLPNLPPVDSLPTLSTDQDRWQILDLLFEPSPQLHSLSTPLLKQHPFASYADMIAAVGAQLTDLASTDPHRLDSILGSHPRLGAKKVESAQSQAEQAQLQGDPHETEALRRLNDEYEAQYPGLRYVVFVNGRPRPVIMDDMRARIANSDIESERMAAIRVSMDPVLARVWSLDTGRC
jgi:2-oxo-4-hydroxy-4-carboxy--5-ureidoimidazoline (OHCU) decarboxylase